jgi:hypothetical protein
MRNSIKVLIVFCVATLLFAACSTDGEFTVKVFKHVD